MKTLGKGCLSVCKLPTKIILTAALCLCLTGCAQSDAAVPTGSAVPSEPESSPSLTIHADHNPDSGLTTIPAEECGGYFINGLNYRYLTNVTIEINGETVKLEDALKQGITSMEEIFACARRDAEAGFCEAAYESSHGLTHFTFYYPDYNLRIVNDVYETPDGKQHLIQDMELYSSDAGNSTFILGPYTKFMDYSTGNYLDREDWGLSIEPESSSSSGIRIRCVQSGGQQIGQLVISNYTLSNTEGTLPRYDSEQLSSEFDFALNMDGTSVIEIDWTEIYGELPSGNYCLTLDIDDIFDETQVHPLMEDYYDWQIYDIEFSIPQ